MDRSFQLGLIKSLRFGAPAHEARHDLPLPRSPMASLVTGAMFIGFCVPLFTVSDSISGEMDSLFDLVFTLFNLFWLLGWSVGVLFLGATTAAMLFARETLYLSAGIVTLQREMFGAGFRTEYAGADISNIRLDEHIEGAKEGWRGQHIVFDHPDGSAHIGSKIEAAEGEELIRLIQSYSEQPPRRAIEQDEPAPAPESLPREPAQAEPAGYLSVVFLIGANLVPFAGVLFFGWQVGDIMLLFWAESAIIGFYNLCKMWLIGKWAVLFMGPFFVGHFGGFMVGHLLFIYGFVITGPEGGSVPTADVLKDFVMLAPALLALFVSHGYSFAANFVGRKEYVGRSIGDQMTEPYRRIIVMHLTLIFGAFLFFAFDSTLAVLVLMIVLKVGADLKAHLDQHR